jgi:hypothetical protein
LSNSCKTNSYSSSCTAATTETLHLISVVSVTILYLAQVKPLESDSYLPWRDKPAVLDAP